MTPVLAARCLQVWQVFRIVLQPQLTWHILSRVAGLSKLHNILVVLGYKSKSIGILLEQQIIDLMTDQA